MLSVSASANPVANCVSTSAGSPTEAATTSSPKGNGFALQFLALLQTSETANASQAGALPTAGDDASIQSTADSTPFDGPANANRVARPVAGKRASAEERLLLSGSLHSYYPGAQAQPAGALQANGSMKDSASQQSTTGCTNVATGFDAAAAQSIPSVPGGQDLVAAVVSPSGISEPIASEHFATQPTPSPTRHITTGPAQISFPPSPVLSGELPVKLSAQGTPGHDSTDGLSVAQASNVAPEASLPSVRKSESAGLAETLQAASTEQGLLATRPELAFGARLNTTALPARGTSVAAHTESLETNAARERPEAVEAPVEASTTASGTKSGSQSTQAFERSHDDQSSHGSEQSPFRETPPDLRVSAGGDTATASATPRLAAATPEILRGDAPQGDATSSSKTPMRELSLRVAGDSAQSADVRLVERNGEIQVSVRASDPKLAESLRSNVNELVNNLSRSDLNADIWHPGVAAQKSMASDAREESGGQTPSSQPGEQGSSHSGGKEHGREGRQAPEWLEELDAVPVQGSTRRNTNDSQSFI